jgi:hypothetical protein
MQTPYVTFDVCKLELEPEHQIRTLYVTLHKEQKIRAPYVAFDVCKLELKAVHICLVVWYKITIALEKTTISLIFVVVQQQITRVGQNRIYTPYMTVYLAISLPKIP